MDKTVYSALVQLVIHAESITWNRFYNFLMANSILVLAWAVIYVSRSYSPIVTITLLSICILGGLSGPFWAGLGFRGRKFLDVYVKLASNIEADTSLWPNTILQYKPFSKTRDLIRSLPCGWSGSRYILVAAPLAFMILYIVLTVASLTR